MPVTQAGALTGRRRKPGYVAAIEAQTPHLPEKYRLEKQAELDAEKMAMEERALSQQAKWQKRQSKLDKKRFLLEKDQAKYAKKQGKMANLISGGKLLTNLYMGNKRANLYDKTGGATSGKTGTAGKAGASGSGWGSWLKEGATSLGTGYLAGSFVDDKEDKKKKAGYGAAAGAVTSYLGSGNLYKAALGAILGGTGGFFS